MARIFITGSADGIGQLAAKALIEMGHAVVLHARSEERGREAIDQASGAEAVVTADLADLDATKELATKVNALGRFDAVIHNAAIKDTPGGTLFTVNTLAPYILTCLIQPPERLIYLSSDMHKGGRAKLDAFKTAPARITYSDSKLHVLMLAKAVALRWPDVFANALSPGWVPTKMGGPSAPDTLESGYQTQIWLATTQDPAAKVTGRYFFHQRETPHNPEADDPDSQDKLMALCEQITGVPFPAN